MKWPALVAVFALLAPPQSPVRDGGAAPATGTATISGVVVTDEASGRPLRRVVVTLNGNDVNVARTTITDDEGRFTFSTLPAGRFSLVATKAAYVTTYYGGKRPGRAPAVPIPIADGQSLRNVTVKMLRGGVVTGRLVDSNGLPMTIASVGVYEVKTTSTGERIAVGYARGSYADERGIYRIYGLAPGEYVVSASTLRSSSSGAEVRSTSAADLQRALAAVEGRAGAPAQVMAAPPAPVSVPMLGYTSIFYPGTPDFASATAVSVGPGEVRADVDFPMPLVRITTLSGAVTSADGRALGETMIALSSSGPLGGSNAGMQTDRSGAFTYRNLTPGQYSMLVRATPAASSGGSAPPRLWATTDLTLDGREMSALALSVQPGATVSGRVVFDASSPAAVPDMSKVRVSLDTSSVAIRSFGFIPPSVQPDANGGFSFTSVGPGKYQLLATVQNPGPGSTWTLRSSMMNGHDVAELPGDIGLGDTLTGAVVTLTDRLTELSGVFRDAAGKPTTDYLVVVLSTDRRYWTRGSRRVVGPFRPGLDGRFTVRDLPPGEYFLAASTDIDSAELNDVTVLEELASKATRITLAEGEKKTQDVRISGLPGS